MCSLQLFSGCTVLSARAVDDGRAPRRLSAAVQVDEEAAGSAGPVTWAPVLWGLLGSWESCINGALLMIGCFTMVSGVSRGLQSAINPDG